MLQHFTWQQFLIAALIFTAIWYVVIALLLYRKELNDFINGKPKAETLPEPLKQVWDEDWEEEPEAEENLVGKARLPEGVFRLGMDQFSFAAPIAATAEKEAQLGLVPDVLEELKIIFSILASEDGSKADFFSLLKTVKEKYPKITADPNIDSINIYIREHVPFHLSNEELEDLWI